MEIKERKDAILQVSQTVPSRLGDMNFSPTVTKWYTVREERFWLRGWSKWYYFFKYELIYFFFCFWQGEMCCSTSIPKSPLRFWICVKSMKTLTLIVTICLCLPLSSSLQHLVFPSTRYYRLSLCIKWNMCIMYGSMSLTWN